MSSPLKLAVVLSLAASVALAATPPKSPPQPTPKIRVGEPHVVLGGNTAVEVVVLPTHPGAVLRSAVNTGTLTPVGPEKGEERLFRYQPPTERVPQVALLVFWEEGKAEPALAVHRLPLHGRMALEVTTRPGARVTVRVGGRDFGPVRASRAGGASVDVEVPPGVVTAEVRAHTSQQQKATALPLNVPASNPLLALLIPDTLDPKRPSALWVLHTDLLPGPMLEFTSRSVRLERVRFWRDRALFRVWAAPDGREPRIEVRLSGQPEAVTVLEPKS